MMGRCSAFMSP
uniref:Uncharacterized protein n=1 Tax=Anguilla anguilla TaxID=7936 RepID=A0A0E9VDF1_ANGAN